MSNVKFLMSNVVVLIVCWVEKKSPKGGKGPKGIGWVGFVK